MEPCNIGEMPDLQVFGKSELKFEPDLRKILARMRKELIEESD